MFVVQILAVQAYVPCHFIRQQMTVYLTAATASNYRVGGQRKDLPEGLFAELGSTAVNRTAWYQSCYTMRACCSHS